jgi:large subunit ribosomal protein L34
MLKMFIICGQHLYDFNRIKNTKVSTTYKPKKRKRSKTHGFLKRKKTPGGKKVIKRRMQKGRRRIAV